MYLPVSFPLILFVIVETRYYYAACLTIIIKTLELVYFFGMEGIHWKGSLGLLWLLYKIMHFSLCTYGKWHKQSFLKSDQLIKAYFTAFCEFPGSKIHAHAITMIRKYLLKVLNLNFEFIFFFNEGNSTSVTSTAFQAGPHYTSIIYNKVNKSIKS